MIPRFGRPVDHEVNYRPRPGVYAVLFRNNHILLTVQNTLTEPEVQLPGGGIDPGEHPIPALHREILEETGWRVSGLRRFGAYRRFTFMEDYGFWAEKLCHIYSGRPTIQAGGPTEPDHTALWATPTMAIDMLESEGDRQFLGRFLTNFAQ